MFDFSNCLSSSSQPSKQLAEIVTNARTLHGIKILFNLFPIHGAPKAPRESFGGVCRHPPSKLLSGIPPEASLCPVHGLSFAGIPLEAPPCPVHAFPLHSIMDSLSFESELLWPKVTNQFWNACCLL